MTTSRPTSHPSNTELKTKSVVILFTVGAIMLVAPLGTVLSENSICRVNATSCDHTEAYRYLVSSFPYIMLGGGVLIAYNMKRVADSINSSSDDESEEEEDGSSFSSYS